MKMLLGKAERQSYEEERTKLEGSLVNPLVTDKVAVRKQIRRVQHSLDTQSPPVLTGPGLDAEVRLEKELREEFVPKMLSQEEMRKAPPGAVGRFMAGENSFECKEKILRWKNCQRTIHRESDDPEIASIERFRPTVSNLNMHGAQIPGQNFNFPSQQFLEGYDGIDWSTRTREPGEEMESFKSRIRREQLAEMRAQTVVLEAEVSDAEEAQAKKDAKKERLPLSERLSMKED